ncbi:MAG: CoA transferase [Myxococcales bacterium]|nr:CoA transferase [Myxococcales bacterium]
MAARPLAGIRVLDLTRLYPGPYLTLVLADLGADVAKVEDPRLGDYLRELPPARAGLSGRFLALNRDKRSLALDLKHPAGREVLLRMVERADVVVESFRPGVLDRLGVGWSTLSARNPRVILCSISGYGQTGPYRERAGHDLNYIALAGVLAMTGAAGGAPVLPGVQLADLAGGAMWGAVGILAALVGRQATGQGRHLDISMTEGALTLLAAELGSMAVGGAAPTRGAGTLNGGLACYGVYATADGKYLSVGGLEPKFWAAFNQAIGRKVDLSELILPPEGQARVRAEVQTILATRSRDAWMATFAKTDACCEPVLELDELAAHPQHRARGLFFTTDHPGVGPVEQLRTPVGEAAATRLAPKLGEHSNELLGEYGFSDSEVATLRGDGVLG